MRYPRSIKRFPRKIKKTNVRNNLWLLRERQKLSLRTKIMMTKSRIKEWYEYWKGKVYISFSGGKDSTVLLHQVRKIYKDIPAVFVDTGLEYPEIREFVKTVDNVIWLKPKLLFNKVIEIYGYPIISKDNAQKIDEIRNSNSEELINKRLNGDKNGNGKLPNKWKFLINSDFKISAKCCEIMKKSPVRIYEKETGRKPFLGMMADDSFSRITSYLRTGCNSFSSNRPVSLPMAFWTDRNVWRYIRNSKITYSKIYDMGYMNTGCMFCLFGIQFEKRENRFHRMKKTHPKQYDYCINKLGCSKVLDFLGITY